MDHIRSNGVMPAATALLGSMAYASASSEEDIPLSSFERRHEADNVELEQTRHAFDVERTSDYHAWTERVVVEVRARSARDARSHVNFSLDDFEQIVSPVLRVA
jgi:hypothetical protein